MTDWTDYDPAWTEQEFYAAGARDDLGIETLGEAILADLLPGINNQNRRARYYSFWAWALKSFIEDPDAQPHTQSKFWEWLRSREDTLSLVYLAHDCSGGIAVRFHRGHYCCRIASKCASPGGKTYHRGYREKMPVLCGNYQTRSNRLPLLWERIARNSGRARINPNFES